VLAALFGGLVVAGEALAWHPVATTKVVVALFGATVVLRLALGERRSDVPAALWAWLGFGLFAASSYAWTADIEATRRVARHLLQEGVLLGLLAISPERDRLLRALGLGLVVGAAVMAAGFVLALVLSDPRGRRLALWEGDPNQQARGIALGLIVGLSIARRRALVIALLLGVGLGLTGSRSAWLATLVGVGLLAWRPPKGAAGTRLAVGAAVAGVVVGALLLSARPDVRPALPRSDREALTSGRDAMWLNTLDIVRDHPLGGVGLGATPAVYTAYKEARTLRGGFTSKPARDPHNHFLQLLAELGPAGLVLFCVGLLAVVADLRGSGARRRATPLLVWAVLAAGTINAIEQKWFWLALAWVALMAAPRLRPIKPASKPAD
jgi:O-antigen ligase